MRDENVNSYICPLENGYVIRVHILAPHTFRIQFRDHDFGEDSALVRYGILNMEAQENSKYTFITLTDTYVIETSEARLSINKADGQLSLTKPDLSVLLENKIAPWNTKSEGFGTVFLLQEGEKIVGLGDVTRDRIQKRDYKTMMWVCNVQSYVPVPYIMSNRGWGILVNTTWRHFFDIGHDVKDALRFWGSRGELDYVLFVGDDYPTLLNRYTNVSGKPHLLPLWGYGLTFVCNQQADAREMLDDCLNFRREDIPCDLVGLEPGWMSEYYDYTADKQWHPDRFYIPPWGPVGPHTFLAAAQRLGFKMSLWLCCDYDLSYEAERRAGAAGYTQPQVGQQHPDDFELDYHQHTPVLMDTITRPEEPWFDHLKKFVDQGVSAFKMDGARQVNEHPDRKWGNGMNDEEMHNLYPTLLNQQMHEGFKEHTNFRPMVYSSGGYTGIQRYSATWAGDTGGGPKPLVSMLNHGLSGHVNVSCDMDVFTPMGIHFGFLQTWSQVCSWAYWRHPWLLGEELLAIFKYYAHLRYKLLPYIYSMAYIASQTGMPLMRAMTLVYPDIEDFDNVTHQYMFGDAFLTAAFTDEIVLPPGTWVDFWTGDEYEGMQTISYTVPDGRGGPLFVKTGMLFPMWPAMDYVGHKPLDTLELHLYPRRDTAAKSSFTLYEDDGETFDYQNGGYAKTLISMSREVDGILLTLNPRQGVFKGISEHRHFKIYVYTHEKPEKILIDKQVLCHDMWAWDSDTHVLKVKLEHLELRTVPTSVEIRF